MLKELPEETQAEVHKLRTMFEGKHNCKSLEDLDCNFDALRYRIADIVLSKLMIEDVKANH